MKTVWWNEDEEILVFQKQERKRGESRDKQRGDEERWREKSKESMAKRDMLVHV